MKKIFFNFLDEKLGWLVGALTVMVLFLIIIIVVLVVCRSRFFRTKLPALLETISPSEKKRNDALFNTQYLTEQTAKIESNNPNNLSVHHVLPNRSPNLYGRVQKPSIPRSKSHDNTLNVS